MPKKHKKEQDDLTFDYQFEGKLNDRYKTLATRIARVVDELGYIEPDDFGVIISLGPPPSRGGKKVVAEMNYVTHWLRQYVEYALQRPLPPYIMILYPLIFKMPYKEKVQVLIHELFHINDNKRGCRPHSGFGDEVITKMYASNLKRLESVGRESPKTARRGRGKN